MAFREDATNEDIVSVMQGKLAHTVFLKRTKPCDYPVIVYKDKDKIFISQLSTADEPQVFNSQES